MLIEIIQNYIYRKKELQRVQIICSVFILESKVGTEWGADESAIYSVTVSTLPNYG